MNLTLKGYLDVAGCEWPDSSMFTWTLSLEDRPLILPQIIDQNKSNLKGFYGTDEGGDVLIVVWFSGESVMLSKCRTRRGYSNSRIFAESNTTGYVDDITYSGGK